MSPLLTFLLCCAMQNNKTTALEKFKKNINAHGGFTPAASYPSKMR